MNGETELQLLFFTDLGIVPTDNLPPQSAQKKLENDFVFRK
jgi:hypothetical protein